MLPHGKDMVGRRFGKWLVLHRHHATKGENQARWVCRCDCGSEKVVRGDNLRRGWSNMCRRCGGTASDPSRKLGVVTIQRLSGLGRSKWRVRCEHGHEYVRAASSIQRHAHSKTAPKCDECGLTVKALVAALRSVSIAPISHKEAKALAQRKRSNKRRHPQEYSIWSGMRSRCANAKRSDYKMYGGKGISVCERWMCFENFFADMGPRPSPAHSLDRYPNQRGNYEPGNVRWATARQQANNTYDNRLVTHHGVTRSVSEWARVQGLTVSALFGRLNNGWSIARALLTPMRQKRSNRKATSAEAKVA
jgi:hypothetical protein